MTVYPQVQQIAADILQLPAERITPESSPENTEGWDSVQNLNLVLALEQRFDLQFEPDEIDRMKTIGDIAALVDSRRKARG